ncbi:MAG: methyltransferase [Gemmatimonadota bacterium]
MTHTASPESSGFSLPRLRAAWQLRVRAERRVAAAALRAAGVEARTPEDPEKIRVEVAVAALLPARAALRAAGWQPSADPADAALIREGVPLELIPIGVGAPWAARAQYGLHHIAALLRAGLAGQRRRSVHFMDLDLIIPPGVFAPNPTTELLAKTALAHLDPDRETRAVDGGTGGGAVALALARYRPRARVWGTDTSARACRAARANARRLDLQRAVFLRGSLLEPLPRELAGTVDLIAANLPWLPPVLLAAERARGRLWLAPAETMSGGGQDGLALLRGFIPRAAEYLQPGGVLALQAAEWQTGTVAELLLAAGFGQPTRSQPDHPLVAFLEG